MDVKAAAMYLEDQGMAWRALLSKLEGMIGAMKNCIPRERRDTDEVLKNLLVDAQQKHIEARSRLDQDIIAGLEALRDGKPLPVLRLRLEEVSYVKIIRTVCSNFNEAQRQKSEPASGFVLPPQVSNIGGEGPISRAISAIADCIPTAGLAVANSSSALTSLDASSNAAQNAPEESEIFEDKISKCSASEDAPSINQQTGWAAVAARACKAKKQESDGDLDKPASSASLSRNDELDTESKRLEDEVLCALKAFLSQAKFHGKRVEVARLYGCLSAKNFEKHRMDFIVHGANDFHKFLQRYPEHLILSKDLKTVQLANGSGKSSADGSSKSKERRPPLQPSNENVPAIKKGQMAAMKQLIIESYFLDRRFPLVRGKSGGEEYIEDIARSIASEAIKLAFRCVSPLEVMENPVGSVRQIMPIAEEQVVRKICKGMPCTMLGDEEFAEYTYRTHLCPQYLALGSCRVPPYIRADGKCEMAHSEKQLRPRRRVLLCFSIMHNKTCPYIRSCPYAHDPSEFGMVIEGLVSFDQLSEDEFLPPTDFMSVGENECGICLEDSENMRQRTLRCGHYFHETCISEWLSIMKSCPQCRLPVDATEPEADAFETLFLEENLRRSISSVLFVGWSKLNGMADIPEAERTILALCEESFLRHQDFGESLSLEILFIELANLLGTFYYKKRIASQAGVTTMQLLVPFLRKNSSHFAIDKTKTRVSLCRYPKLLIKKAYSLLSSVSLSAGDLFTAMVKSGECGQIMSEFRITVEDFRNFLRHQPQFCLDEKSDIVMAWNFQSLPIYTGYLGTTISNSSCVVSSSCDSFKAFDWIEQRFHEYFGAFNFVELEKVACKLEVNATTILNCLRRCSSDRIIWNERGCVAFIAIQNDTDRKDARRTCFFNFALPIMIQAYCCRWVGYTFQNLFEIIAAEIDRSEFAKTSIMEKGGLSSSTFGEFLKEFIAVGKYSLDIERGRIRFFDEFREFHKASIGEPVSS